MQGTYPELDLFQKNTKVAVQGPTTAKTFQEHFDSRELLLPKAYNSESLAETLLEQLDPNDPVLIIEGSLSLGIVWEKLKERRFTPTRLTCYKTIPKLEKSRDYQALKDLSSKDCIFTFFSPSAFQAAVKDPLISKKLKTAQIVTIGKTTSASVREQGYQVSYQSDISTQAGVIDTIKAFVGNL